MSLEKSMQANAEYERMEAQRLKAHDDDSPYDEIVRLRSQLIARQAELIAKEADIARKDRTIFALNEEYRELRESYDKLLAQMDEARVTITKLENETFGLRDSRDQAVHGYHGVNCGKRIHGAHGGYLHGPDDDSPYDVDGCRYCGRCHIAL